MAGKKYSIGIDFGTSTSEICRYEDGKAVPIPDPSSSVRSPIVPSIVAINRHGELIVGEAARTIVDRKDHGIREIKRLFGTGDSVVLGEKTYRPEQIASLILKHLKQNAELALSTTISDVVLSVPAFYPDAKRQATLDAGELAGLTITRLISEPTAAALAFGIDHLDLEEQMMVFDFGGGTLDITILEMFEGILDAKSSFGDNLLGGKDFDEVMIRLILEKFRKNHPKYSISETQERSLKPVAETAKIMLSRNFSHIVEVSNFAIIRGEPVDLEVEITRQDFERAAAPLLDRARNCLHQALKAKEIRPSTIDRVIMVGGTTYIPCVRQLVSEILNKETQTEVNPDLAVAMGATIQSAIMRGEIKEEKGIILTDISPYGLGLDILKEFGQQMILTYDPLIEPQTTIPYSVQKEYSLLTEHQEVLELKLYQDPTGEARIPDDAIFTGISAQIMNIPPSYSGQPHDVLVDFSYNLNAMVRLHAMIPATDQEVEVTYTPNLLRLSDGLEKERALADVESLWQQNPNSKEHMIYLQKAERLLPELPDEQRKKLSGIIDQLKSALSRQDDTGIQEHSDQLIDFMIEIEN